MMRHVAGAVCTVSPADRGSLRRAALGAIALLASAASAAQQGADEPFLVFDRSHPLMPATAEPMVQVFDSGRVVVTRGPGWTRPGRYEFKLDAAELARLKALAASGASANLPSAAAPVREIVNGREVFTVVHDAVTTSVRVRTTGTDGSLSLAGALATVRVIEVEDLASRADASVSAVGAGALVDLERSLLDVFAEPLGEDVR